MLGIADHFQTDETVYIVTKRYPKTPKPHEMDLICVELIMIEID